MVTTPRLTYQDYANLEGDERYELLDGELILVAAPNEDHQTASLRMIVRMKAFVDENDLGRVFHAPYDVLFTDTDVVQPDVLFVSKERYHIRTPANIQGAPDLAVEILSPPSSRRDGTISASCTLATASGSTGSSILLTASYRSSSSGTACSRSSRPAQKETLLSPWSSRASASAWRSFSRSNPSPCGPCSDRLGESPARGIPSARGPGALPCFAVRRGRPWRCRLDSGIRSSEEQHAPPSTLTWLHRDMGCRTAFAPHANLPDRNSRQAQSEFK